MSCGWESVYIDHCQPGHTAHLHASGVWSHCQVHHSHTDAVGALTTRLHPPAHQNSPQGCPWDAAEHRAAQPGELRPQPAVWTFYINIKVWILSRLFSVWASLTWTEWFLFYHGSIKCTVNLSTLEFSIEEERHVHCHSYWRCVGSLISLYKEKYCFPMYVC